MKCKAKEAIKTQITKIQKIMALKNMYNSIRNGTF